MGYFSQKGLFYSFEILQGLLSNKNMKIRMRKKNLGTPPSPLKKPIFGRQKPKWAVWPRRGCHRIIIFLHGLLIHKNMKITMKKKIFQGAPYPPKKADFGRTKAKMSRFSQKDLCYSFELLLLLLLFF